MNKTFVVDTNILAYFFEGVDAAGEIIASNEIIISSITYVELLSNRSLSKKQRKLIKDFFETISIVQTNQKICDLASKLCLSYSIKSADAIIAATAFFMDTSFVTADKALFKIK